MAAIDYIGWAGRGNLGDDGCLKAIRRLAGDVHELTQTDDPQAGACILGGGTLLFGESFLRPAMLAVSRKTRLGILGSGVDLTVPVPEWEPKRREGWERVLAAASVVGVRGPRSLEAVRQLGREDASVIGDPGLSLGRRRDPRSGNHQRDLVLVSASSDYPPGCGRLRLLSEVFDVVEWLKRLGLDVRFLALRPNDLTHGRPLIEQAELPVVAPSIDECLKTVRRAHLVVSLRLHGAVFAGAFGVPFVSLAYQGKCSDFCASMGVPWAAVRTDRDFSAAAIRGAIERIDADYDAVAKQLVQVADRMRARQKAAFKKFSQGLPNP